MGKRPTGSGGEPSSPNCGASAGVKARHLYLPGPSKTSTYVVLKASQALLYHLGVSRNLNVEHLWLDSQDYFAGDRRTTCVSFCPLTIPYEQNVQLGASLSLLAQVITVKRVRLQVVCKKSGSDIGTANVVSRTKGNMFGNIILGGGIGAIVDHNNGAAYEYPGLIKVYMGRTNQRIEEQAPTQASTSSQATVNSSTVKNSEATLEDAKKKCIDLGFQQATEGFGNCVLKLAK